MILNSINFDHLLKLRLAVARHGEQDVANWWNTKGLLGGMGFIALSRGFPKTHYFAQARIVFVVAKSRCEELFNPPGSMTLWNLPPDIEDQFESQWQNWLDNIDEWEPFFERLAAHQKGDLMTFLVELNLVTQDQEEEVLNLKRSAEGKAVAVQGFHLPNDNIITLLAAAFAKGEPQRPAIPYTKLEE